MEESKVIEIIKQNRETATRIAELTAELENITARLLAVEATIIIVELGFDDGNAGKNNRSRDLVEMRAFSQSEMWCELVETKRELELQIAIKRSELREGEQLVEYAIAVARKE